MSESDAISVAGSNSESTTGPMFPRICSYVVLSLDPVTTLESLDDKLVLAAARKIHTRKYVAYVASAVSFLDNTAQFQAFEMEFLRQGLPKSSTERFLEPAMCTPVMPNTEHPLSRTPLQPEKSLPWPNCYHASFDKADVRVRTRYADAELAIRMPFDQVEQHLEYIDEDRDRQDQLRDAYEASHLDSALSRPQVNEAPNQGQNTEIAEITETNCNIKVETVDGPNDELQDRLPGDVEGEEDIQGNAMQEFMTMMDETRPSETLPLAEMTYDLSSVSVVEDPEHFFEECRIIAEIEADYHARMNANRAAAIERARRLDDEAFGANSKADKKAQLERVSLPISLSVEPTPLPIEQHPSTQSEPPKIEPELQSPGVTAKKPFATLMGFFNKHPFWGHAADPPSTIVIVTRRCKRVLRRAVKRFACGTLGSSENLESKSEKHAEETA